jgi:TonB family protein
MDLEITVGVDGRGRDAMLLTPSGSTQVDAFAVRAAANSYFEAGRLDGQPVAVRMPLELRPTPR